MRKVLLIGLMAFAVEAPSASAQASAQAHLMNKTEFELFLHDLERDTSRWMNVVSEVDVASLKDLSYEKGQLMDEVKGTLRANLLAIRHDVTSLKNHVTLVGQIDLLMGIEEAEGSMEELVTDLNIVVENPVDAVKYSKWVNDATTAFKEINATSLKFYEHLRELSLRIDFQTDVSKIH